MRKLACRAKNIWSWVLTFIATGCIDDESRHHALALRAVRLTPVRRRSQNPREPAAAIGLRPSAVLENNHVQVQRRTRVREDHSQRARLSRREACRCGSGLRSRSRPAQRDETDWLRSVGTSRWREKRDVSGPVVLRERGTPELRTAATRQRGAECTGGNQAVHPRRVHPRPGSRLIGQRSPRRCGLSPAAWGPSSSPGWLEE